MAEESSEADACSRSFTEGDRIAGWWFAILVPQPNGSVNRHIWVLAVPDEAHARERLHLSENPADYEHGPLSEADLHRIGLDPGEVRRLLDPP